METVKLNENEVKVLEACKQSVIDCTGNEFGYTDELPKIEGLERKQIRGYLSQLEQKGLIVIEEEYKQLWIKKAAENFIDISDILSFESQMGEC